MSGPSDALHTDALELGLGANTAAADAATPGSAVLGNGLTLVSRELAVRTRQQVALYVIITGTAKVNINAKGAPEDGGTPPFAVLDGGDIVVGETVTTGKWFTIDVSLTPFLQLEFIEDGTGSGTVQAWMVVQ